MSGTAHRLPSGIEAEVRELQAAGVLAVEMELAAVYAAAQVRGVAAAGL